MYIPDQLQLYSTTPLLISRAQLFPGVSAANVDIWLGDSMCTRPGNLKEEQ